MIHFTNFDVGALKPQNWQNQKSHVNFVAVTSCDITLITVLLYSFCLSPQDDMSDSLRDYTNLPEAAPLLTILDMSARAKYVRDVEEITSAVVDQFVSDFLAEKLKPEPI